MRWLVVALAASSCVPPTGREAKVWTIREFQARRETDAPIFGGWRPSDLLVQKGAPLPFSTATQRDDAVGLTVFPGVSEGQPLAFVITDIWQDHPEPWVQPVYIPAARQDETAPIVERDEPPVFPVNLDSAFYSPWWRQHFVVLPEGEGFRTVKGALDGRAPPVLGGIVLCPIVPSAEFSVSAAAGQPIRHPLTNASLRGSRPRKAWFEGRELDYLGFGVGRLAADGQRLVQGSLYVFVDASGNALPLATVFPPAASATGFFDRVDLPVPAGAKVFVPSSRPDLKTGLGDLAPDVDPMLDANVARALQVVTNPECLTPAAFSTCRWLDSEAALEPYRAAFRRRPVQVTAPVLAVMP